MANLCVSRTALGQRRVPAARGDPARSRPSATTTPCCSRSKFIGITNGITHRRWLMQANPAPDGADWTRPSARAGIKDPEQLEELHALCRRRGLLRAVRRGQARQQGAPVRAWHEAPCRASSIDPDTIFDAQAKRLHEYKRQLMNIAAHPRALQPHRGRSQLCRSTPRTFLFGAKAAPGYYARQADHQADQLCRRAWWQTHPRASQMINDRVPGELLRVRAPSVLMPAADVSEQLSTAGKEASGTGNMKFMMNGARDDRHHGRRQRGDLQRASAPDNIFIFGLTRRRGGSVRITTNIAPARSTRPIPIHPPRHGSARSTARSARRTRICSRSSTTRCSSATTAAWPTPTSCCKDSARATLATQEIAWARLISNPRLVAEDGGHQHGQVRHTSPPTAPSREYNDKIWHLEPLEL